MKSSAEISNNVDIDEHRQPNDETLERAVAIKLSEVDPNDYRRWQSIAVKNDPDGSKAQEIMTDLFFDLAAAMGVENFLGAPANLLEQIACTSLLRNDSIKSVVEAAYRGALIAYACPDTTDAAKHHLAELLKLASQAQGDSVSCDCPTCTNANSHTLH